MYLNRGRTAQTLSQLSWDFGVGWRRMEAAQCRLLVSHYAQELLFFTWKQLVGKRNFRVYPQPLQPYTVLHESFPLKLRRWGTQSYHCTRLYKRYKRPFLLKLIAGEWNNLFFFYKRIVSLFCPHTLFVDLTSVIVKWKRKGKRMREISELKYLG